MALLSSDSSRCPSTSPAASSRCRCMCNSGRLSCRSRASWLTYVLPSASAATIRRRCGFASALSTSRSRSPFIPITTRLDLLTPVRKTLRMTGRTVNKRPAEVRRPANPRRFYWQDDVPRRVLSGCVARGLQTHRATDDLLHDLGGAAIDRLNTRVHVRLRDRVLRHVSVSPVQLQARGGDLVL